MRYFIVIAVAVLGLLLWFAPADSQIRLITLSKSEIGWTVTYQLNEPVSQLEFVRSPNNSRATRWQPLTDNIEIAWQNGSEVIRSQNGEPFTEAAFTLDASYTTLPKDYAPFSPFSDGGMLVHTARFFACAESCGAAHHEWPMAVNLTTNDYMLVDGQLRLGFHEWLDRDSGRAIYIGSQPPETFSALVAIIDPALPSSLRQNMITELPMIMSYYTKELGALSQTPTLFASYSDFDGSYYGHQGGVLPNQVFMHWYGEQALDNVDEQNTLWFFAHEIAHLFQGAGLKYSSSDEAWIHEGAAELMSYLYTDAKLAKSNQLVQDAVRKAQTECVASWPASEPFVIVGRINFKAHYSCGLVANAELHAQLQANGIRSGIFALWETYSELVADGAAADSETYFAAFEQLTGYASMSLRQLIDRPVSASIAP
ncbi:hypothetical protein [Pseudidiomarina marina]|uniref:Peptidase M1 membrane alanine aminopeptidase domain-containing protein n=1 Tax=Pseudidiomarina marina TaxID=502366 RepID=A0A432YCC1_9GAMM|nr:hypothetical protein [Pseudidiomarina marina]RUO58655.1 hypothetical protein CWI76_11060 [Pseudidiomarina marina]